MEQTLAGVSCRCCVVYLDNLLVHAPNFAGALQHLQVVFAAIRQAGLQLNPKKCNLLRKKTTFLGHVLSAAGVATNPAKVAAGLS